MRRPTKALTAATLVVALSATIIRGQQSSRGTPSATGADATSSPASGSNPALSGRGARSLLRNGQDYLGYQEYSRALKYLREAEIRQNELSKDERQDLKTAIEKAMTGLRAPANGSAHRYAKGPTKRPGAIALAKPPGADKEIQLASTQGPAPKAEDGTTLPYLPKEEAILPVEEASSSQVAMAPRSVEPPALTLESEPAAVIPPIAVQQVPARIEQVAPQPIPDQGLAAQVAPTPLELLASSELPTSVPLAPAPVAIDLEPPLPVLATDQLPIAAAPAEIAVPAADLNVAAPVPVADAPVRTVSAISPASPAEDRLPDPSPLVEEPLPPLPGERPMAQTASVRVPRTEAIEPDLTPVPTPAPEPLPPLPDQPPTARTEALQADPGGLNVEVEPPPAAEADPLPPLPSTSEKPSIPDPVELPVAATPTSSVELDRPRQVEERTTPLSATAESDNSAFFRRPDVQMESSLSPELRREVERIARTQDEAARRNPPSTIMSDANDPTRPSTKLIVPRAPSPTEARTIKAIPVPEDFKPLVARNWTAQRKYWAAAGT